MPRPSHPPLLDYSNYTWRRVQIMTFLVMQFSPLSFIPPRSKSPQRPVLRHNLTAKAQVSHPYRTRGKITVLYILIYMFLEYFCVICVFVCCVLLLARLPADETPLLSVQLINNNNNVRNALSVTSSSDSDALPTWSLASARNLQCTLAVILDISNADSGAPPPPNMVWDAGLCLMTWTQNDGQKKQLWPNLRSYLEMWLEETEKRHVFSIRAAGQHTATWNWLHLQGRNCNMFLREFGDHKTDYSCSLWVAIDGGFDW
jgi:hypothetical protein